MKFFQYQPAFFLFLLLSLSCEQSKKSDFHSKNDKVLSTEDGFYQDIEGFDYDRIPVKKPYYLMRLSENEDWIFQKDNSANTVVNVVEFNTKDNYFFGKHDAYEIMEVKRQAAWFIFEMENGDIIFFNDINSWYQALLKRKIKDIQLYNINQAWIELRNFGKCSWCSK